MLRQLLLLLVLGGLAFGRFTFYERYLGDEQVQGATDPAGQRRGGREVSVETVFAETRTIRTRIEAVGDTRALQAVNIVPQDAGQVVSIAFESGERVEAGAVLVELDDTLTQAAVAEAQARLHETRVALDRARKLQASRNIAQSAVDETVAAEEAATAQLQAARKRLEDRTIRAPFAGTVGIRNVDLGARIDTSTVVTTLDDLSGVEVEFSVPEIRFGAVRIGQTITARAAAWPDRLFEGRIDVIDSRVSPSARAFRVRAVIPNGDGALTAGMFLYVEVALDEREALLVPEEAVQAAASSSYLFIVEDGKAVRREVHVGQRQDGTAEIVEGIEPGDEVITAGIQRIREGIAVSTGAGDDERPTSGSDGA